MSKRFLVILLVGILGLIGIYKVTSKSSTEGTKDKTTKATPSEHVLGANKKQVSFVEYGDYQCPYCGQYYPLIKQVVEKYKDNIEFKFRNFPLQQHTNARAASRAAEAAGKQNKYWEMHDLLYEQQKTWETSTAATSVFDSFAQQLSLDMVKYKADFSSPEVNEVINADAAEGTKLGVDSTPSFYLQGKKMDPTPTDVDGFSKAIDEAIKNSKQ